jgi:hypothetical protein
VHDYWIVTELSNIFERERSAGLPEDVLITAAGGAPEVGAPPPRHDRGVQRFPL